MLREERPYLRHDKLGHWRPGEIRDSTTCCARTEFRSLSAAVTHLTSAWHFATLHGLPEWQVSVVLRHALAACGPDVGDSAPAARFIREDGGLAALWSAGVNPDDVIAFAKPVHFVGEPMPVRYYEGIAYAHHDASWIPDVLRYRPDPETATWLAWLERPEAIGEMPELAKWLGFGIPRQDWLVACGQRLSPDRVFEVSAATGWSTSKSAGSIIAWARAGCFPTPEQFATLARTGRDYARPGTAALALLIGDLERLRVDIDRTDLGVMLAITDHRYHVLAAVQQGVRGVPELLEYVEERRSA